MAVVTERSIVARSLKMYKQLQERIASSERDIVLNSAWCLETFIF